MTTGPTADELAAIRQESDADAEVAAQSALDEAFRDTDAVPLRRAGQITAQEYAEDPRSGGIGRRAAEERLNGLVKAGLWATGWARINKRRRRVWWKVRGGTNE